MADVSLDKKSLTELRSIAMAMGMEPKWDVGKEKLLDQIHNHVAAKVQQPPKPIEVDIKQDSNAPRMTKEDMEKALTDFMPLGLTLKFPTDHTWEMYCNKRTDSGTMNMPIWNVIQCARDLVRS